MVLILMYEIHIFLFYFWLFLFFSFKSKMYKLYLVVYAKWLNILNLNIWFDFFGLVWFETNQTEPFGLIKYWTKWVRHILWFGLDRFKFGWVGLVRFGLVFCPPLIKANWINKMSDNHHVTNPSVGSSPYICCQRESLLVLSKNFLHFFFPRRTHCRNLLCACFSTNRRI